MKKKTIISTAFLAFAFGVSFAQHPDGRYGIDVNQNDGVIIRSNNDNYIPSGWGAENIRFQVGVTGGNTSSYTAEINKQGLVVNGNLNAGTTTVDTFFSTGIRLIGNSKNFGTSEGSFKIEANILARNNADHILFTSSGQTVARFDKDGSYFDTKLGLGTSSPAEKMHIREGNLRVDSGQYQSWGAIILHPDVDNNGDDRISFRNSTDTEMAAIQDGNILLNGGGFIQSNGHLILRPDANNSGNDDRISIRNSANEETSFFQDGTLTTNRVVLNIGSFPDYVFAKDYYLMPLSQVAEYINVNKHLPNMPSEAEIIKNGMSVGQINTILVEKIEELTLHTINQEKEINTLKDELLKRTSSQEEKIDALILELARIKTILNQ